MGADPTLEVWLGARDAYCGKIAMNAAEPKDPQHEKRLPLNAEPHIAARKSLQDQYVQLTRGDVDTPDPTGFFVRVKTSSLTESKMVYGAQ